MTGPDGRVEYGVQIPYAVLADRAELLAWMRRADDGPFRTLSIGERITYDNPDQVAAMAAAAAVTSRVRLLTNVSILPFHAAAHAAKAFATIDRLSEGRLILTPGVGSRAEDFAAVGSSFSRRWQRLDDTIAEMQALWRGEPAEPGGTRLGPPPFRPGGPPLHCSAQGPKALARAVRWASGYQGFTTNGDIEMLRGLADRITEAFASAGRPRPELGVSCFFALGPGSHERLRDVVGRYYGFADPAIQKMTVNSLTIATPEAVQATVTNAAAAGFDEVHFLPTTADPSEIERLQDALSPR